MTSFDKRIKGNKEIKYWLLLFKVKKVLWQNFPFAFRFYLHLLAIVFRFFFLTLVFC